MKISRVDEKSYNLEVLLSSLELAAVPLQQRCKGERMVETEGRMRLESFSRTQTKKRILWHRILCVGAFVDLK